MKVKEGQVEGEGRKSSVLELKGDFSCVFGCLGGGKNHIGDLAWQFWHGWRKQIKEESSLDWCE